MSEAFGRLTFEHYVELSTIRLENEKQGVKFLNTLLKTEDPPHSSPSTKTDEKVFKSNQQIKPFISIRP